MQMFFLLLLCAAAAVAAAASASSVAVVVVFRFYRKTRKVNKLWLRVESSRVCVKLPRLVCTYFNYASLIGDAASFL